MVRTEYRSAQSGRTFTVVVLCEQGTRPSDFTPQKAALRQQRASVFGRGWLDDEAAAGNALVRRLDAGHVLAALDAEAVALHRPCSRESLFKTLKKLHHSRDIRDRALRAVPDLLGRADAILHQEGLVRVMTTREVKARRRMLRAARSEEQLGGGLASAPESSPEGGQDLELDMTPDTVGFSPVQEIQPAASSEYMPEDPSQPDTVFWF
eukprot:m51a1_g4999 hypothetical protein (209) ;mRNA; f:219890-220662